MPAHAIGHDVDILFGEQKEIVLVMRALHSPRGYCRHNELSSFVPIASGIGGRGITAYSYTGTTVPDSGASKPFNESRLLLDSIVSPRGQSDTD